MITTLKRTLFLVTLSATRAFSLYLAVSHAGVSFGMLPGITLFQ